MHLLFLSSGPPNFGHSQSYHTVLATLIESMVKKGHEVSWAEVASDSPIDRSSSLRLNKMGVRFVGDFSDDLDWGEQKGLIHQISRLRKTLWSSHRDDIPRFKNPDKVAKSIEACGADAAILHWDTHFEHIIPAFKKIPLIAYWAKPRHASAMNQAEIQIAATSFPKSFFWILMRQKLRFQRERHFARARKLCAASNMCALDTIEYNRNGVPCTLIHNTWPDAFGQDWKIRRKKAERTNEEFGILGSVGVLHATGNVIGIDFWSKNVLPVLEKELSQEKWKINVCGKGVERMPSDILLRLDSSRVNKKGFVDNIDQEMIANRIFLICNHAGTVTGVNTRVMYAMSSGSCIVSHRNIADSMPEIRHRENALLGSNGREIAQLIIEAFKNPELVSNIGENARKTYEQIYAPDKVADSLVKLIKNSI